MTSETKFKNECNRLRNLFFGKQKYYSSYYDEGHVNENAKENDKYLYQSGSTDEQQWCTFQIKKPNFNKSDCYNFSEHFYGKDNKEIKQMYNGHIYSNSGITYSDYFKDFSNYSACTFYMKAYIVNNTNPRAVYNYQINQQF